MHRRIYLLVPLAVVCLFLLFVGGPDFDAPRTLRYGWDLGHLLVFALWAYLYALWRAERSFERLVVEVALLALVLGGLSELVQAGIGRQAAWSDLGRDLAGGLLGLALAPLRPGLLKTWLIRLFRVGVCGAVLLSLIPFLQVAVDDLIAWRQFPLLSGFETPFEASRWSGSVRREVERLVSFSGQAGLRLNLDTQRYAGIGLRSFPRDWQDFRHLSLQVYNPDPKPLQLYFRIHDHDHRASGNAYTDRFNTRFLLRQGWNNLQVKLAEVAAAPRGRQLDLSRVAGLNLYVDKLDRSRIIYLDEVRLLP